jgi:hypothetical protein
MLAFGAFLLSSAPDPVYAAHALNMSNMSTKSMVFEIDDNDEEQTATCIGAPKKGKYKVKGDKVANPNDWWKPGSPKLLPVGPNGKPLGTEPIDGEFYDVRYDPNNSSCTVRMQFIKDPIRPDDSYWDYS